MGASSSKSQKQHKRHKVKQKTANEGRQDIVRGQKLIVSADTNANTTTPGGDHSRSAPGGVMTAIYTDIPRERGGQRPAVTDNLQSNNSNQSSAMGQSKQTSHGANQSKQATQSGIQSNPATQSSVQSNQPIGGKPKQVTQNYTQSNQPTQSEYHVLEHCTVAENAQSPAVALGRSSGCRERPVSQQSSDEEYLDVPTIIRSVPEVKKDPNTNTIKQAGVNVKDRISYFKENNTPVPAARSSYIPRPTSRGERPAEGGSNPLPTTQQQNRISEPAIIADHRPREDNSERAKSIPSPDYDPGRDEGRMNTLDYFNQVQREQSLLKGFEKAKPAARLKKSKPNSPKRNHDSKNRPISMFVVAPNFSDPDITAQTTGQSERLLDNPLYYDQSCISSAVNSRTGQKYSIDDADYATLSRKKKIVGQRLPVGAVDKQTEKNFLLSLKRNIQLKQVKNQETGGAGTSSGNQLHGAVF